MMITKKDRLALLWAGFILMVPVSIVLGWMTTHSLYDSDRGFYGGLQMASIIGGLILLALSAILWVESSEGLE